MFKYFQTIICYQFSTYFILSNHIECNQLKKKDVHEYLRLRKQYKFSQEDGELRIIYEIIFVSINNFRNCAISLLLVEEMKS